MKVAVLLLLALLPAVVLGGFGQSELVYNVSVENTQCILVSNSNSSFTPQYCVTILQSILAEHRR